MDLVCGIPPTAMSDATAMVVAITTLMIFGFTALMI